MRISLVPMFHFSLWFAFLWTARLPAAEAYRPTLPLRVPVLVVKYFPVQGQLIDQKIIGHARDRLHIDTLAGEAHADELRRACLESHQLATVASGVDVGDIVTSGGQPALRGEQRR